MSRGIWPDWGWIIDAVRIFSASSRSIKPLAGSHFNQQDSVINRSVSKNGRLRPLTCVRLRHYSAKHLIQH